MKRLPKPVLLWALVLMLLTGCSSTEAGFGLPVLDTSDAASVIAAGGTEPRRMSGTLALETNGCFTWRSEEGAEERPWIVWPDDARQDGDGVILGSGARIGDGDSLEVVGAVVALAVLPDGKSSSSYFGSFGPFCRADKTGALVLTDIAR